MDNLTFRKHGDPRCDASFQLFGFNTVEGSRIRRCQPTVGGYLRGGLNSRRSVRPSDRTRSRLVDAQVKRSRNRAMVSLGLSEGTARGRE